MLVDVYRRLRPRRTGSAQFNYSSDETMPAVAEFEYSGCRLAMLKKIEEEYGWHRKLLNYHFLPGPYSLL
jgi:hypothetical protein